jgi:hypothetical protein
MKTQFGLFFVANSIKIMKQDVIVGAGLADYLLPFTCTVKAEKCY